MGAVACAKQVVDFGNLHMTNRVELLELLLDFRRLRVVPYGFGRTGPVERDAKVAPDGTSAILNVRRPGLRAGASTQ